MANRFIGPLRALARPPEQWLTRPRHPPVHPADPRLRPNIPNRHPIGPITQLIMIRTAHPADHALFAHGTKTLHDSSGARPSCPREAMIRRGRQPQTRLRGADNPPVDLVAGFVLHGASDLQPQSNKIFGDLWHVMTRNPVTAQSRESPVDGGSGVRWQPRTTCSAMIARVCCVRLPERH